VLDLGQGPGLSLALFLFICIACLLLMGPTGGLQGNYGPRRVHMQLVFA
jgi:hypothetical protein